APSLSIREGVKRENDRISLKVAGQGGSVAQFEMKLMRARCGRQGGTEPGLPVRQIRFQFDGQPVKEADTPA
ncbi:SUMO3 protein, partial [Mionectes macconnelli]|nr:SUMO3 protein [Mionectes macconnelli]